MIKVRVRTIGLTTWKFFREEEPYGDGDESNPFPKISTVKMQSNIDLVLLHFYKNTIS